ncbi:MAG TPA: hypothetical protein VGU74_02625 [Gemmatimonadales bacterium]|nr:hypothetical protein [Gemmatimonadales bacterium]
MQSFDPHSVFLIDNEASFARFEATLQQRLAELETKLIKWMFVFWVPTALGIIGTAIAVVALLIR